MVEKRVGNSVVKSQARFWTTQQAMNIAIGQFSFIYRRASFKSGPRNPISDAIYSSAIALWKEKDAAKICLESGFYCSDKQKCGIVQQ